MRHILDLDPVPRAFRVVAAVASLGDDPFESHGAGGAEYDCPVHILDMLAQPDAVTGIGEKLPRAAAEG